jgi:nucleoside phosphorylase
MAHYLFPDEADVVDAHAKQIARHWAANARPDRLLAVAESTEVPGVYNEGRFILWQCETSAIYVWRYDDTALLVGIHSPTNQAGTFETLNVTIGAQRASMGWFTQGPSEPFPYATSFVHLWEYDHYPQPPQDEGPWVESVLEEADPDGRIRWSWLEQSTYLIVAPEESHAFHEWFFDHSYLPRLLLFLGKVNRYKCEIERCWHLGAGYKFNARQSETIRRKLENLRAAISNFDREWCRAGLSPAYTSALRNHFTQIHKSALIRCEHHVDEILTPNEANMSTKTPENAADIVILTALDEERNAVLAYLRAPQELKAKDRVSYRAKVGGRDVVLLSMHGMGNTRAAATTQQAIGVWNPKAIFLLGITGGVPKANERLLGDLLIPEVLVQYDYGKAKPEGFERRFEPYRLSSDWLNLAHATKPEDWVHRIRAPRPDGTTGRVLPHVHFGTILSGNRS